MILVVKLPKSGVPEASSKIEPTEAIALIQQPPKNKPLLGVIAFMTIYLEGWVLQLLPKSLVWLILELLGGYFERDLQIVCH